MSKLTLCHVTNAMWCESDNAMCHYWMWNSQFSPCISYFDSIWFNFL